MGWATVLSDIIEFLPSLVSISKYNSHIIINRYRRWGRSANQSLRGGEREASQEMRVQPQPQSSQVNFIFFCMNPKCNEILRLLKCILRFNEVSTLSGNKMSFVESELIDHRSELAILNFADNCLLVQKKFWWKLQFADEQNSFNVFPFCLLWSFMNYFWSWCCYFAE